MPARWPRPTSSASARDLGVAWSVTDVDADPELRAEYGDRVPVILIDGEEHGYWQVEEDRLRAALTG